MNNEKLNQVCEEFFQTNQLQAMDVSLHHKNQEVFHYRQGKVANKGPKIKETTMFSIGSISKIFTTVAVLMLVEEGKIDLDQPVCRYLPMLKMPDARYKKMTVRMLLNHSSGLAGNGFKGKYANAKNRKHLRECMDYANSSILKDEPGKFSVYCNDGFSMAELLVELVAQESFSGFIYERICEPCQMDNTDFPIHELMDGRYIRAKSPWGLDYPQEYVNGIGSGGIYSTAEDLCKFYDALSSGRLLKEETLAQMNQDQRPQGLVIADDTQHRYGLGWDIVSVRLFEGMKLQALSKSGSTFGFSSNALMIPELEVSCAAVVCGDCSVSPLTQQLAYFLALECACLEDEIPALPPLTTLTHPVEISGVYANTYATYRVRFENGLMTIEKRTSEGWVMELRGLKEDQGIFIGEPQQTILGQKEGKLSFVCANDTVYVVLDFPGKTRAEATERMVIAQKLVPAYKPSAWQTFEGKVWIMDNEFYMARKCGIVPMTFYVEQEKGFEDCLMFPYPLKIVNDDQAIPFLEIPGNNSREMSQLCILLDGSIQLGQYHYILQEQLQDLTLKELVLRDALTHWFIGNKGIDTLKIDGNARCLILDEKGEVEFDSMLSATIPQSIRGKRIGFLGEINSKITLTYLEDQA